MAIFFFVVGLAVRREMHRGELSGWRRAALPAAAALGGMLAPTALYLALAGHATTRAGWGVPMATDIAFAVGILTLLGRRVPASLRVLLLALAAIDDLGAIIVIALFYSSGVAFSGMAVAGAGIASIVTWHALRVRSKLAHVPPVLVVWGGVHAAGIHPAIVGVLVELATPVRTRPGSDGETIPSPTENLIEALHPWIAFGIMPVSALANAGVVVSSRSTDARATSVTVAVALGLVVGRPAGALAASWLATRGRVASVPRGIGMRHMVVLGIVAGVGFTMALFGAQLAFADVGLLVAAKLGVLAASGLSAVPGLGVAR